MSTTSADDASRRSLQSKPLPLASIVMTHVTTLLFRALPAPLSTLTASSSATALMFAAFTVNAQSAGSKAAAEAIFEQGKQLMQTGDFGQACTKFEASQKLDQGVGTLLYLADCYEKLGRTASAWATFKEAASVAGAQGQETRQKLAVQRARALEPDLAKLTIEVAAGNESILGFEVRSDGVAVPPAQYATPFPIDPGTHHIEAGAPGKRTHTETINVTRGVSHVNLPLLIDLTPPGTPPVAAGPASSTTLGPSSSGAAPVLVASPARSAQTTNDSVSDQDKTQRTLSYIAGGLGVVGIGLGAYFGIAALHNNSSSKDNCQPDPNTCPELGYNQRQDALRDGRISTVSFVAGGALLTTAAVLYFTAKPNQSNRVTAQAQVSGQSALLNLQTSW